MQGKDSISFGSIHESSVWNTHQQPAIKNSINFGQLLPSSREHLSADNDSMISKMPGLSLADGTTQSPLRQNVDMVCLMQAAQIERLTRDLEDCRIKLKEVHNEPLDRQSYEMQIKELSDICEAFSVENQKFKEYAIAQNKQISELNQKISFIESAGNHLNVDRADNLNDKLSKVSAKYEKSLQSLNKLYTDNEKLTDEVSQLSSQTQELQNQIYEMELRRQTFESERIREIQRMRESFEMKFHEQMSNKELERESQLTLQNSQIQTQNQQLEAKVLELKKNIANLSLQLQNTQTKYIKLSEENKKLGGQKELVVKQLEGERVQNNKQIKDFDEKIKMFGDQVQRLNLLLGKRQRSLEESTAGLQSTAENLRVKSEELKGSIKRVSELEERLEESQNLCVDRNGQIKGLLQEKGSLESQLSHIEQNVVRLAGQLEKQMQSVTEKNSEIERLKKELAEAQKDRNTELSSRQRQLRDHVQRAQKQELHLREQVARERHNCELLKENCADLSARIELNMQKHLAEAQYKEGIISEYEQKIKSYFQLNEQLQKEVQDLLSSNKQLKMEKSKTQYKIIEIERIKSSLQKQLEKQIVSFSSSNHKAKELLLQHDYQVKLSDHQGEYAQNHKALLDQIAKITRQLLGKEREKQALESKVDELCEVISKLEAQIRHLTGTVTEGLSSVENNIVKERLQRQQFEQQQKQRSVDCLHICHQEKQLLIERISDTNQSHIEEVSQLKLKEQEFLERLENILKGQEKLSRDLRQSNQQQIIQNAISLTKSNEELKVAIERKELEIQNIQNNYNSTREELISQREKNRSYEEILKTKQTLIEELSKINESIQTKLLEDPRQETKSQTPEDFDMFINLVEKFKQLNEELAHKIDRQIQKDRANQGGTFESKINPFFSFDGSEKADSAEEQKTFLQTISELKSQITRTEESYKREIASYQEQLSKASEQNMFLVEENSNLNSENRQKQQELEEMFKTCSMLTEDLEEFKKQFYEQTHKFEGFLKQRTANLNQQLELLKKQLSNRSETLRNYQKKTEILNEELEKYYQITAELKQQNLHLSSANYDIVIELEKAKITTSKIDVLNEEIRRLEKENIDLIEQVDLCRFQICGDYSLEKRNEELLVLVVMLNIEIESLRSRVKEKDVEIDTIRKSNLTPFRREF